MAIPADPPRRSDDERAADDRQLVEHAEALAAGIDAVIAPWIQRLVLDRVRQTSGEVTPEIVAAAAVAGEAARADVMVEMRALLRTDVDDQRQNPLALLRAATRHAAAVLAEAGVPEPQRDEFAERSFPDDHHGLVPMAWIDIDETLHPLGITWGAAKAYVFKARRRDEGKT